MKIKLQAIAPTRSDSEDAILYKNFYQDIQNENLLMLFSIIHSKLNSLFYFMNSKNFQGNGGHYNAAESRELLEIIKDTNVILATLESENYDPSYKIDDYYMDTIKKCKTFLKASSGSAIPESFPEIEVIEHKPIFIPTSTTSIAQQQNTFNARLKQIGSGSYAQVFKYRDPHYNIDFAIKRAKTDLKEEELNRFKIEFEHLKNLNSPYIIKAYRYSEDKNEYTMEFADQTLEKYISLNNSKLPFVKRRNLVMQLLRAFNYIHEASLLHRDISYQNILLKHYDDNTSILKVSDFGLVKVEESQLTRQGTEIKGTLNDYADLNNIGFENYGIVHETFALGKIIYYILTGRKSNYNKETNTSLKEFILKATASNKNERFASVAEIHQALVNKVFPSLN